METIPLKAQLRTEVGSRSAKHLRAFGAVPGVLYGKGTDTTCISVNARELLAAIGHHRAEGTLVNLQVAGADVGEPLAMIKEVQTHPITRAPLAVDLQRISLTERITVHVSVQFVGAPAGVDEGGVLEHVLREVEVSALPMEVPQVLEVDVSSLQIGHSLRVRDILPPEGVQILTDPDETVAHVGAPSHVEAPAAEAVEEAEVEEEAAKEEAAEEE